MFKFWKKHAHATADDNVVQPLQSCGLPDYLAENLQDLTSKTELIADSSERVAVNIMSITEDTRQLATDAIRSESNGGSG